MKSKVDFHGVTTDNMRNRCFVGNKPKMAELFISLFETTIHDHHLIQISFIDSFATLNEIWLLNRITEQLNGLFHYVSY